MINSRDKGGRVERELVAWLVEHGIESAERTAQRSGKGGPSDVRALELSKFHIECKGTKGALLTRSTLLSWVNQITVDCLPNLTPVIFHKANGKDWVGIVTTEVYHKLRLDRHLIPCVEESLNSSKILADFNLFYRIDNNARNGRGNKCMFPSIGYELKENESYIYAVSGLDLLDAMKIMQNSPWINTKENLRDVQHRLLNSNDLRTPMMNDNNLPATGTEVK